MTTAVEPLDPAAVMAKLDGYGAELDRLSQELDGIEQHYGPIVDRYRGFVDDFVVAMYERYEDGEGKWPGEDVREKLARKNMVERDRDLRDSYDMYTAQRAKLRRRIEDVRDLIGGQRSILSALREEMAATR